MMAYGKKIGVFGLGSIGLRHAKNLLSLGCDVMAFDPSEERQNLFIAEGGKIGAKADVLEYCDGVVIASPNQFHLDDLKLCVEHGCHAFVEKPLAHKIDGLDDIARMAKDKGLVAAVAMNIRLNPAMRYLKNKLVSGDIGKIIWGEYTFHSYLPDWRPDQDHTKGYAADIKTGGIIFDATHGLDLAHYLLGAYEVRGCVARCSGLIDIPSDDLADILCVHDNGVTSRLHMDYVTKPKEHSYTVATDQGFAYVHISNRSYRFTSRDGAVVEEVAFTDTTVNDDYTLELAEFIQAINGDDVDYCSIDHGICVTKAAVEARKLAGLPS